MDKDELNKFKWLDAQEVKPQKRAPADMQLLKAESRMTKKMIEFLIDE